MNDELKEILNRLDYNEWEVDLYKIPITWCEMYDIRDYIETLQKQLKAYENMRKEALKTIHETDDKPPKYYELKSDLLNILNKVGGSDD